MQFSRPIGEALECGHARLHHLVRHSPLPCLTPVRLALSLSPTSLLCVASAHDFCCSSAAAAARSAAAAATTLAETASPQLFLTTGELDRQKGPAVYFLRTTKPGVEVADGSPETALSFGTLPARAIEGLQVVLSQLYKPMVEQESKAWKPGVGVDDSTAEFFNAYGKFGDVRSDDAGP